MNFEIRNLRLYIPEEPHKISEDTQTNLTKTEGRKMNYEPIINEFIRKGYIHAKELDSDSINLLISKGFVMMDEKLFINYKWIKEAAEDCDEYTSLSDFRRFIEIETFMYHICFMQEELLKKVKPIVKMASLLINTECTEEEISVFFKYMFILLWGWLLRDENVAKRVGNSEKYNLADIYLKYLLV